MQLRVPQQTHNEIVTEILLPEIVHGLTCVRKLVILHERSHSFDGCIQPAQDPLVTTSAANKRVDELNHGAGRRIPVQVHEHKLSRLPQLVAELAVAHNLRDVQVDVTTLHTTLKQRISSRRHAASRAR